MLCNRSPLRRRGFSLIELMVVITIIGVLATIVTVKVMDSLAKANVTTTKAQMNEIKKVLQSYSMDNGHQFPKTLSSLMNKNKLTDEPYMEELPQDAWSNDFSYKRLKNGRDFELISFGADRRDGGQGVETDITLTKSGFRKKK